MSILIKGMEMPKSCEDCRFCTGLADTEWGTCAGCLIDDEYREASSKSGCPLVEVPTPHGRLIEVTDELLTALSNFTAETGIDEAPYMSASDWIEMNAPTVIEAEEGENE